MHARNDRNGLREFVSFALAALLTLVVAWPGAAVAVQVVMEAAQPGPMSAEQARAQAEARRAQVQAQQAQAQAAAKANPAQPPTEQKSAENKSAEKKDDKSNSITRPEKPPREPDPDELEVVLNDQNLVPVFNFQGQPWPAVLAWYAKLANATLDWQELPNDYVNLFTLQPQPLDEVRNLLNRLLLARGFTLLQRDRVISVFKVENIEPGLVEQIDEIELYNRKPYDFVKVPFKLPEKMAVDKAKDDLKQVLSPKAKVLPFVSSHQVLVLDAVANLRTVSEMLNIERAKEEGKSPLRHFLLKHRRAEDVIDILYVTLGMDPKSKPSQQELQAKQQEMQLMQQLIQRGQTPPKLLKPEDPPVFLSYNSQLNSVIANAPEEQMKMIEETIKWLDVPLGGVATGVPASATSLSTRVMQTYKLKTLDPVKFKTTLDDIGELSPFTTIQADQAGQAILVQGPPSDQKKIADLISELDGEERQMKVIPLSRYPAEQAAISIRELIAGESSKKDDSQQDPYYQYLMSMANRNQPQKEDPHKGFYVAADVIRNRLLVKANRRELEQIYNLLRELGEVLDDRHEGVAMRVIDPTSKDLLDQLRKAWAETGGNPLLINQAAPAAPADATKVETEDEAKKATQPARDRGVQAPPADTPAVLARFATAQSTTSSAASPSAGESPADEAGTAAPPTTSTEETPAETKSQETPAPEEAPKSAAAAPPAKEPVSISITPDGRLVIRSQDAEAVARLEALIAELTPPPQRIKRFPILHSTASNMMWNLKDVFAEELAEEGGQMIRDWYTGRYHQLGEDSGTGLARRPKLAITYDPATNSVLVANATAAQLREIEDLIKELDRPVQEDMKASQSRVTATIKIKYSRASIIAAALKEVYIDLLSSRDREFATGDERRSDTSSFKYMTQFKFGDSNGATYGEPTKLAIAFNGELSVGADDVSNNLLISCREELYDGVVAMIKKLDEEAAPPMGLFIHEIEGSVGADQIQKAMSDSLGRAWLGGRPEDQIARGGPQQPGQNQGENGQPQGNRGNRGRRGR